MNRWAMRAVAARVAGLVVAPAGNAPVAPVCGIRSGSLEKAAGGGPSTWSPRTKVRGGWGRRRAAGGALRRRFIGVLAAGLAVLGVGVGTAAGASGDLGPPTSTAPELASPHGPTATLVGVRVGRHLDYDRTVFDLRGAVPGWNVRYVPALEEDASGRRLPIRGADVLHVALLGVDAHNARFASTLRTPSTLTPEFPTLRQVRIAGDFEAVVSFGLGLRDRVGFRVFSLTNPTRVVVDVAHQPRQPFGTAPVAGRGNAVNALVTGIRAGRHPGYDRLVFDLQGAGLPMFGARYTGSGATIQVGLAGLGSATSAPHGSYGGPRVVPIGLPELRSVTFTGSGAGGVGFLVATAHRHGFRVMALLRPSRVVLDVAY
ncbi:MAG TPA: hypothetical protein VGJ59_24805 [Jatrophihabitantaceae bacterium]